MARSIGLLALGLLGALGGAWATPSAACECKPRAEHAAEEMGRHKSAFAGRVKDVRAQGDRSLVTFEVYRVWKGPRGKELAVTTGGECAASFEAGKDYLVYAEGDKADLSTDRCGESPLEEAARAVRQLDLQTGRGASPLRVPARGSSTASR